MAGDNFSINVFSVFRFLFNKEGREKGREKELILFFPGMGIGINSFFKSRNEEWELIPFFEREWEWDYNLKNEGKSSSYVYLKWKKGGQRHF